MSLDDSLHATSTAGSAAVASPKFLTYNPDIFSSLQIFFQNFERFCDAEHFSSEQQQRILPTILSGELLCFYFDNDLASLPYEECKQVLLQIFDKSRKERIKQFHELSFRDSEELLPFFTQKLALGKSIGLTDSALIDYLTLALPTYLQRFLVLKDIKTSMEWLSIVRQLTAFSGYQAPSHTISLEGRSGGQMTSQVGESTMRPQFFSPRLGGRNQQSFVQRAANSPFPRAPRPVEGDHRAHYVNQRGQNRRYNSTANFRPPED